MKKFFAMLLAVTMVLGLVACSGTQGAAPADLLRASVKHCRGIFCLFRDGAA